MLCDLIAESVEKDPVYRAPSPFRQVASEYYRRVSESQRYVLNRDAVWTTHHISEMLPSKFLAALQVCRLPQPSMWIEFAYRDRDDYFRDAEARGFTFRKSDAASEPSRLGFLVEQADDSGYEMLIQPAWVFPEHGWPHVEICCLALRVNAAPGFEPAPQVDERAVRQALAADDMTIRQKWTAAEFDAAVALNGRMEFVFPDRMRPLWDTVRKAGALDQMWASAKFDLLAEWRFIMALLMLLNSKNAVRYGEPKDFTKLNKKRAGTGKPQLLSHRDVYLSLTRVQRNALAAAGLSRGEMEAHLVRPHFKIRKTGIFFWSAHVRGDGEPPPPGSRTYRVTG